MAQQYDNLMGSEQRQEDHPDNSHSYKMAGDVVPMPVRPSDTMAAIAQGVNKNSMKDIAAKGPSAVDTTNLKLFKPK